MDLCLGSGFDVKVDRLYHKAGLLFPPFLFSLASRRFFLSGNDVVRAIDF